MSGRDTATLGVRISVNALMLDGFDRGEAAQIQAKLETELGRLVQTYGATQRGFSGGQFTRVCPKVRLVVEPDKSISAIAHKLAMQIFRENFAVANGMDMEALRHD